MKIGVSIPAYNVENTILKVLEAFSPSTLEKLDEILVIDNNSADSTARKVQDVVSGSSHLSKKVSLIKHAKNYGYGESQKTAFQYFIDTGKTHVMIIHGDNQGNAEVIATNFLKTWEAQPDIDVIVASRFTKESDISKYSLARRLGNYFFNFLTHIVTGQKMSDSGTGIIFIKTEVLKKLPFKSFTGTWQFHPEMNILLYENKDLKLKEIPLHWADSEAVPTIKLFQYCVKLSYILIRYSVLKNIFRKSPEKIFLRDSPQN